LTPNDEQSAPIIAYAYKQSTAGFNIGFTNTPKPNTTYQFEYFL